MTTKDQRLAEDTKAAAELAEDIKAIIVEQNYQAYLKGRESLRAENEPTLVAIKKAMHAILNGESLDPHYVINQTIVLLDHLTATSQTEVEG